MLNSAQTLKRLLDLAPEVFTLLRLEHRFQRLDSAPVAERAERDNDSSPDAVSIILTEHGEQGFDRPFVAHVTERHRYEQRGCGWSPLAGFKQSTQVGFFQLTFEDFPRHRDICK